MDAYEATKIVFSKIQKLDPENASKIIGLLLFQDHGDKEMIRLAFGPESLVQSVILRLRKELEISSSTPSPPSFRGGAGIRPPSSLSIPNSNSNFSNFQTPNDIYRPHNNGIDKFPVSAAPEFGFYGGEVTGDFQLQDQLSFLNERPDFGSNPIRNYDGDLSSHRRSLSVSNIGVGSDDSVSGFGWKPCVYYARGYCKNGNNCKFLHGSSSNDSSAIVGFPSKLEMTEQQYEELLRSKSAHHQQRLTAASQLLSSVSFPSQRAAVALLMNDEMNKLGRSRLNFPINSMADMNSSARQIYLTFPAESTFSEEDVSNYFSNYGPVHDVRIPYQPKRMFGFVTFVFADTVKNILAKGNPHFVCDARVLVKPYKEKGKLLDKKQNGDCHSPSSLDSRDTFDIPIGPRMFYNNHEMLWRKKLEEEAIELQSRRLMSLQLLDLKKHHHLHHRAHSVGAAPIGSPIQSPNFFHQSPFSHSDHSSSSESPPENCSSPAMAVSNPHLQQSVYVAAEKESLEHNLPDSPFASPTKAAAADSGEVFEKNTAASPFLPTGPTLDVSSFKSFCFQMPRFSSGHGAIGM